MVILLAMALVLASSCQRKLASSASSVLNLYKSLDSRFRGNDEPRKFWLE